MTQLRSHPRLVRKLQEALGDQLCVALDDASVVEIMLNPDGKLFIDRLGHGVALAGEMSSAAAEIVVGTVAHALQSEVDKEQPIISGELPIGGHRSRGSFPRSWQGLPLRFGAAPHASSPSKTMSAPG